MSPARSIFNQEMGEIGRSLRAAERGRLTSAADPSVIRRLRQLTTSRVRQMTERLSSELASSTRDSLEESLRGLARFSGRMTGSAGPLEDETTFRALVSSRRSTIESARRTALADLQRRLDERILTRLTDVAATDGAKIRDMLTAVNEELEANWWQIERVVRTESSFAYNAAQVDGIRELARTNRGMMMRWTELIDDATGQPFDNRVAMDSFAMHGQVAPIGGVFTMPSSLPRSSPGKGSSGSLAHLVGMSWMHPPNRPNDRAVLTPWMREWGIPGWRYQSGRRVNLRPRT